MDDLVCVLLDQARGGGVLSMSWEKPRSDFGPLAAIVRVGSFLRRALSLSRWMMLIATLRTIGDGWRRGVIYS